MSILDELQKADPDVKLEQEVVEPEKVVEPNPPSGGLEPGSEEEKPTFDPKTYFKEKFDIDFEDEAKFKEQYSSLTASQQRAAELETQIEAGKTERQKLTEEYEDTFKKKYNLNDNEVRRLLILKEFPDQDVSMLTKIIETDFSKTYKTDPMEVLIAKVRLEDSDIFDNDADAEAEVYRQFGIDPDAVKMENGVPVEDEEGNPVYLYKDKDGKLTLPDLKVKAMQKAAKEANKKFEEIRNKIPIPDKTNLTEEKEKLTKEQTDKNTRLTNQWTPTFKNLPDKALGKIKFERKNAEGKSEVFFEFDVDENFKKEAAKVLIETDLHNFISKGIEYSKEDEQKFVELATESLQKRYLTKQTVTAMLLARENQLLKEWADKEHEDMHNPLKGTGRLGPKVTPKLQAEHDKVEDQIGKRY